MNRRLRLLLVVLVVCGSTRTMRADQPASPNPAPAVTVAQNGAAELYKDLEYILKLTNANEQKQWPVLKDYLDLFLIGVDRDKPMRIDVLLGGKTVRYRPSFPIKSFRDFNQQNIQTLGIDVRVVRGTLYSCRDAFTGFMRYKHGYATFGEKEEDVPPDMPDPSTAVAPLLEKHDLVLDAGNTQTDSAAQEARRTSFRTLRDDWLSAVKKKNEESEDDFLLRKLLFEQQLEEAERLYVEAETLRLGWVTDTDGGQGRLDLNLVPIKGTALEKTFQLLDSEPSRFTAIKRSENPILSMRVNYVLDEMRQQNLLELFDLLRNLEHHQIDAAQHRSDEEKAAARKAVDLTDELLASVVKAGRADGFLEAHATASGKHTLIGGFRAVDGNRVVEILKALQQSREGRQLAINAETAGDVQIHKLTVSPEVHPNFQWFFGSEALYVGSSPETVWLAAGENVLSELKAAIQTTGSSPADSAAKESDKSKADKPAAGVSEAPVFDFFAQMGPWIELRQRRNPEGGNVTLRKLALEAFQPGDDTWSLQLRRVDNAITGKLVAHPGILRLVGKMMADFSKENLDTGQRAAK